MYVLPEGDILQVYGRYGRGNLSGSELDEANRLIDEIIRMKGEIVGESNAITQMVDALRPGIASDVDVIGWIASGFAGGGETARQFGSTKEAANALYERGKQLFIEWNDLFDEQAWDFTRPGVTLATIQDYHRRFHDMLNAHKEFLGKVTEVYEEGPEVVAQRKAPKTGIPKVLEEYMSTILWYGGLAAVGWYVVLPWLKKRGAGA